jgi:Leucine-rich repeat (LRR) protein
MSILFMVNVMQAIENNLNSYPLDTFFEELPVTWRPAADTFISIMLLGPGNFFDEISPLIKEYATESYLVTLATNTFILETCLTSTSMLAFATPIFLIGQLGLLTLLYGRALIEFSIATHEPLQAKEGGQRIDIARWHSSGSQYYEKTLSHLRRPWNNFHKGIAMIGLASSVLIPFVAESFTATVMRLAILAPVGAYLLFKFGQHIVSQQRLNELQAWVDAAPTHQEKGNRSLAQKEILRYLQEDEIDPNPFVDPALDLNFLGLRLAFKTISTYQINFKNLQLTSLPEQLWHLTTLRTLNLEGNQLTELSEKVINLPYLETLNVRYNQLNTLPPQLAAHPNLTQLQTKGNPRLDMPAQISQQSNIAQDSSRCLVQ